MALPSATPMSSLPKQTLEPSQSSPNPVGRSSPNGIAFSDSYVFVAEADAGAVAVIAKPSWKVIATVPSGGKTPDAIYYDPRENSVFVSRDPGSPDPGPPRSACGSWVNCSRGVFI